MFRFSAGTLSIVLALTSAAIAQYEDEGNKHPLPSNSDVQEAVKLVKDVYGADYESAKTDTQKQVLAKKLLTQAASTQILAERYAMLRVARDIAVLISDGDTAFEIIEKMDETFRVNAIEMKAVTLRALSTKAKLPSHHRFVIEQILRLSSSRVGVEQFVTIHELSELAVSEARKLRDTTLLKRSLAHKKQIGRLVELHEQTKLAEKTLETEPADPDANLKAGRFHCFVMGNWNTGLPMLVQSGDVRLATLAAKELNHPVDAMSQAKLGDGWWSLAAEQEEAERAQVERRAIQWYRTAIPGLTGLAKVKVEKRLASLVQAPRDPLRESEPSPPTPKAPDDSVRFGNHRYKVIWQEISWPDAKTACESMGGHLACIETAQEKLFLARLKGTGKAGRGGKAVWVGASRGADGTWKWVSGQKIPDTAFREQTRDYLSYAPLGHFETRPENGHAVRLAQDRIQGYICEWDE